MNYKKIAGAATVAFGIAAGAGNVEAKDGLIQSGMASWYGNEMAKGFKNGKPIFNLTAHGDKFSPNKISAAHKTLPLGSCVKVVAPAYHTSLEVIINDRGPYAKGRIIDLSKKAAEVLGFKDAGETRVQLYPC